MNRFYKSWLLATTVFLLSNGVQAQVWKKVTNHVADKVNEKVDKAFDGKEKKEDADSATAAGSSQNARALVTVPFDFVPGSKLLFQDNFSNDSVGTFPKHWKTHASGSVASVPDIAGHWFLLSNDATYKLDTMLSMPQNFTVEFDVLALCEKARDMSTFYFGFDKDNSTRSYISDIGVAGVALYYMNSDEYYTASKDLGNHHFGNFDLENTINTPMHVSIEVKGNHMQAWLGQTSILDADMFQTGTRKYFFLSAPMNYEHAAQLLISNVKIAEL